MPFIIDSLAHRTDLIFARALGETHDRGEYLVVRHPRNPTYHFGNYLIFARGPHRGDFATWEKIFAREIPGANHRVILWNGIGSDVSEFLANGYELDTNVTLSARPTDLVRPPKWNDDVQVRPLVTDAEWEQAIECEIESRDVRYALEPYTEFARRKYAGYREMERAGHGLWFGAFVGDLVVADLGIFVDGSSELGLGRYQSVGTLPDFRRRGICGTLVYKAGQYAFERMGARELAMVADDDYHAARIYESVGFKPVEKVEFLYRRPPAGGS